MEFSGYDKGESYAALLELCPPDSATLQNCHQDKTSKAENAMLENLFPGMTMVILVMLRHAGNFMALNDISYYLGGFNRYNSPPKVNMAALETDAELRSKLCAIGLEPMADWVTQGYQTNTIPGWIIVACASMFTEHAKLVPQDEKDLEGTPYTKTQNVEDNLDHNGCVECIGELEPSFRNTARFGNRSYGTHC